MAGNNLGRQRRRQERRDIKAQLNAAQPAWTPPTQEECDPEEIHDWPAPADFTRLLLRQRKQYGHLVDFALLLQVDQGTEWIDIARVDCCHGEVHRHGAPTKAGHRDYHTIHKITQQTDVQDGLDHAIDYLTEHASEIERTWRNEH